MIHIIGTTHSKTQFWSDAIKQGQSLDTSTEIVKRFELYLQRAATSLQAQVIAEENSQYCVDQYEGGSSVAKGVAEELGIRHIYCDPDPKERKDLNIQDSKSRELIWMNRIQRYHPNKTSIIFVCGADHSVTFQSLLESKGYQARIHCRDWTVE